MARGLAAEGNRLEYLRPGSCENSPGARWRRQWFRFTQRGRYLAERSPALLKWQAREIGKKIKVFGPDVIFSPGTLPLAYLDTSKPMAFWTDSVFSAMVDYYPGFTGLSGQSLRDGDEAERAALGRVKLAVFSSNWAARAALAYYGAEVSKIRVVPFGANLEVLRDIAEVEGMIARRPDFPVELLFVGREWERKGGRIACEVVSRLMEKKIPARLTVVGCRPPGDILSQPGIESEGFLDKARPEDLRRLEELFSRSHYLLIPSLAECTPVAAAEANSFGVPCLVSETGGMSGVIRGGVNGQIFPRSDFAAECAEYIAQGLLGYRLRALSAFQEYKTRLNWQISCRQVSEALAGIC